MFDILQKIFDKYSDIKYGWYDKNGNLHNHVYEGFLAKFRLQSPDEIRKHKYAVCFETVELYRDELEKMGIPSRTFFFCLNETGYHSHSIIVVEDKGKVYHLEGTYVKYKGVHEYNSVDEAIKYIIDHYEDIVNEPDKKVIKEHINVYEYTKPKYGISCFQYYVHGFMGKKYKK